MSERPTCSDLEASLIGACLRDHNLTPFASECVEADDFFDEIFSYSWQHIMDSFNKGVPASCQKLDKEFNQSGYFNSLMAGSEINDPDTAKHTAMLINDFALRRRMLDIGEELVIRSQSDHLQCQAADIVAEVSGQLSNVKGMSDSSVTAGDVIQEIIDDMVDTSGLKVYSTGIRELDRMMEGGIYASKFYGFAARQKHGKTTTLASISYNLTEQGVPHLYLTLEGATKEIMQTMVARRIGVNRINFLKSQFMTDQESLEMVMEAQRHFKKTGLRMDKKPGMTFSALKNAISRAAIKGQIKGVIVDYIQLVNPDSDFKGTQAQHFDNVAQYLAEAAKVYGVFVLGAAQLNRDGEVRGGDGLLNACDMAIYQHKMQDKQWIDGENGEHEVVWLEMRASRYTPYRNLGSDEQAGAYFVKKCGPYIENIPGVEAR